MESLQQPLEFPSFPLMAMTLELIQGRKPKWQPTNSPDARCLPEKSVPQPHAVPILSGFREPLPYQALDGLPSQYICALLTSEKQGGLKPPLKQRKTRVVASWMQSHNPRNCPRTTRTCHTSLFML